MRILETAWELDNPSRLLKELAGPPMVHSAALIMD